MTAAASPAPLGGHLYHALLLAAWAPVFVAVIGTEKWRARRRRRPDLATVRESRPGCHRSIQMMALCCICAALVHVSVMPGHFRESLWYGLFFLVAAASQIMMAILLVARPSRTLVTATLVACGSIVTLWAVSRTGGVPIGPDHGGTEPLGRLDLLASSAEALAVAGGMMALRRWNGFPAWRLRTWSTGMRAVAALSIIGTIAVSAVGPRS